MYNLFYFVSTTNIITSESSSNNSYLFPLRLRSPAIDLSSLTLTLLCCIVSNLFCLLYPIIQFYLHS
ncbi:hypothetical protein T07_13924, partial [Trichinella nelsoni]